MTQDDSLSDLSAVEMRRCIGTGELSPVDLLTACHRRIDAVNPALNAVVAEDREAALAAAREAEQAVVRGADLGPRREAILTYAEKLTRSPAEVERADVEALRTAGLSDEDILAVCEVVSYYAYANRIVDGLGVQLEAQR